MRTLLHTFLAIALLFSATALVAQSDNLGSILTETVDGISEDAFKNRFDREEWKAGVAKLGFYDIADAKSSLSEMVRDMKGRAFENRSKGDVVRDILSVNNPDGIKEVLAKLLSSLKPDMLKEGFDPDSVLRKFNELD